MNELQTDMKIGGRETMRERRMSVGREEQERKMEGYYIMKM